MSIPPGFWLASFFVQRNAENEMYSEAHRGLVLVESYDLEVGRVLDGMKASPYPPCTPRDLEFEQELVFQTHLIKDVGRMHDGRVDCSALQGGQLQSKLRLLPSFSQTNGINLFYNLPSFRIRQQPTTLLQRGDVFAVIDLDINAHRFNDAANLMIALRNFTAPLDDPVSHMPANLMTVTGKGTWQQLAYATACSRDDVHCVAARMPLRVARRRGWLEYLSYGMLFAVIGTLLGDIVASSYLRERTQLQQLRRAVRREKLTVAYQPVVDLQTGRVVGAEALARWRDEDNNEVPPEVFISLAEKNEFIGEITSQILRRSVKEFAHVIHANPDFHLSVNIAAADLSDCRFLPMLDSVLQDAGVRAQNLIIEITEGSTVRHHIAQQTIRQLRQRGHLVHIDDFGTGYSSLAYLHELDVDAIKIDRAFTQTIGTESWKVGILPQILKMAETLNLHVVVEGVETEVQAEYFKTGQKPVKAQGWMFGKPVSAGDFLQQYHLAQRG